MKSTTDAGYIWQDARWPGYTFDARTIEAAHADADASIRETLALFQKLPVELEPEALAEGVAENALASSRIEGVALNPEELRESALRHLDVAPTESPSKRNPKVEGVVSMIIDATRTPGAPLTLEMLCRWQRALFAKPAEWTGEETAHSSLRAKKVFVVSHQGHEEVIEYEAPPPERVEADAERFISWFNGDSITLPPLVRGGLAHLWFETLHPFPDGNGRVGRALIDRVLAAHYGPESRCIAASHGILRKREDYYAALKAHNRPAGLDATPWLLWFLNNLSESTPHARRTITHVQGKARFWIAHRATPFNERQRKVINRMFDAGPDGFVGGMTNRKYVALTKVSAVTAFRDLSQLVEFKALRAVGAGRSGAYELIVP